MKLYFAESMITVPEVVHCVLDRAAHLEFSLTFVYFCIATCYWLRPVCLSEDLPGMLILSCAHD